MTAIIEWLKGKKSYIVCVLGILTAIVAYLNGAITMTQAIEAIWTAIAGITIRAGVTKSGTTA